MFHSEVKMLIKIYGEGFGRQKLSKRNSDSKDTRLKKAANAGI
ncbi:hypothetical protein PSEHALCIP103_01411 [Pseudoalteromonas haloplanktis]|uniref:Uncharacterized protein n=1 Tax=Pseudoalteromonas haloplanktis TaxID=228 RepID=A0A9W4VPX0_PSEHA|nr:hypothetical protein PSEHALCIP103_01411 [Pseudoalteromonas haloplanktis]